MLRLLRPVSLRAFAILAPPSLVALALSLAASSGMSSPVASDARVDGDASDVRRSDTAKKVDASPPIDAKPGPLDAKVPWGDARIDARFDVFGPLGPDAIPLAKDAASG